MCGIVGLLDRRGQPMSLALLRQMTSVLSHRGPDDQGCHVLSAGTGHVGLGHARLRVIDLSPAAAQPMTNEDESVWLVFNGEIYNFRELRASLETRGARFRTRSDTEVILRLYEAEGERSLSRLDGMFALAIWDGKRQALLLARDRVGKKPLFYAETPDGLLFASEIKALLQHPQVTAQVHTDALPSLFLYGYVPSPDTCYRGIVQLPPGHLLTMERGGKTTLTAYWDVPLSDDGVRGRPPTDEEAAKRVRELTVAAVRRRLVSDVPLGAFLSGGLDSSIVVGVMSGLLREPVRTFSIGFAGDRRFDETAYARRAAKRFGTRHTEFIVEPSAVELIERLVWHHDGPFADSSAIPTYLLAQLTRRHVTVALTGDGGDELFAGYLRFYATLLSEHVPVALRRCARVLLAGLPGWGGQRSLFGRLQKFAGSSALPFAERFSRWASVFYEDLPRLFPDRVCAGGGAFNGKPASLAALEPYLARSANASPLTRLLYLNMKTYLADDLLVKMDRCAMAHALEARSPFLDRELIEYVFSLPDAMKLRWGKTKVILRRAFRDLLPADILARGKMGFGVPLGTWFAGNHLREFLGDLLLAPDVRLKSYLNHRYVQELVQAHLAGAADHAQRLWTLLTFEVWLRQMARGTPVMPRPCFMTSST